MNLHHCDQGSVEVVRLGFLHEKGVDPIVSPTHIEDRAFVEIRREGRSLEGCTCHYHLEVRSVFGYPLDES